MLRKSIYLLPLCSLILGLSSYAHAYNENFGLVENIEADKQLEREELTIKEEVQRFNDEVNNTTEFKPEKGAFLAEDWVQPEELITYHYFDDPKFYREDELPENKGRLGNLVIQVPSSMPKEEFLSKMELGMPQ